MKSMGVTTYDVFFETKIGKYGGERRWVAGFINKQDRTDFVKLIKGRPEYAKGKLVMK